MKDDKKKKSTQKKNVKHTAKPAAKKTTAKNPTKTSKPSEAKKPAVKKIEAKKPTSKTTPKQSKKTDPKVKYPKHNPKEELEIGKERPIIINGKNRAPKREQAAQPSKASVTSRAGRVSSITYHIRYD